MLLEPKYLTPSKSVNDNNSFEKQRIEAAAEYGAATVEDDHQIFDIRVG